MKRILVIEDDETVKVSLQMFLEDNGYQVETATDGEDGVTKFKAQPADLVITDIFMPKKEGIETIAELRGDHPNLKIIAISGGGKQIPGGFLVFAKTLGAAHTFRKPIDLRELLGVVKDLIG